MLPIGSGDGDDAVVDLADRTEILARDVIGGTALLALARVIDDEHAVGGRRSQGSGAEQLQIACDDRFGIPA